MSLNLDIILISVYGYTKIFKKDCKAHQYGQFNRIEDAKEACLNDKICTSVYDVGCGDKSTFHLCTNIKDVLLNDSVSNDCIHEKIIVGNFPNSVLLKIVS